MEAFRALRPEDPSHVGRYRIIARLGAGGMGRVYLGRSPGGRWVAVKVVHPELAENTEFRRRFAREVNAARRVNGFFTAGVVDADPEGVPAWLATAYVAGISLGDAVAAHGPWPLESVLVLGAGLAEALEAIHQAGVVHRDLKPSNVLLAADGPRVIDFGVSVAGDASMLTQAGMTVGTPGFISPEQLTGKPVGTAADIFALGGVLAYAATGSGPFGGGSAHILNYRAVYEDPELEGLPPELRALVEPCLAKDPAQRPTLPALLDRLTGMASKTLDTARVFAETDWLPVPVVRDLHSRASAALPPVPLGGTTPGLGGPEPDPEPRPVRRRTLLGLGAGVAGVSAAALVAGLVGDRWRGAGDDAANIPSGERRWAFATGDAVVSSPAVADGTVYVGSLDGSLYALDAASGARRWAYSTAERVLSSPLVADGVVYVGSLDGQLYALDAENGERLWEFGTDDAVLSSPALGGGYVYVGSGDGNLYAVDAESGAPRWEFATGDVVDSSPATADGVVYVGSLDGRLYAVDAKSGEQLWEFATEGDIFSSPAVVDGTVYVGSADARLYAVDAATGERRWAFAADARVFSSPAVAGGTVYVGSDDSRLYAVDAANGTRRWSFPLTDAAGISSPAVVDGVVYIGSADGNLYAVDAATGRYRWTFTTDASVRSSPAVAGGIVYVGSDDGHLYAVKG
ncbi:outer membrane protein assembly factor BamB family protein [Streptomyces sp. URMC 129]|uniref:outer membrane protein assembly factor BamB family protein n=1 Tax=Streptomyces sp. URMC 129 TaxID=3423407 RepID=UPI003F1D12E8